jgi:hypothetical protein
MHPAPLPCVGMAGAYVPCSLAYIMLLYAEQASWRVHSHRVPVYLSGNVLLAVGCGDYSPLGDATWQSIYSSRHL